MALDGPLDGVKLKRALLNVLERGLLAYIGHAEIEMKKDAINRDHIDHVLRAGLMKMPAEVVRGEWRYRIETRAIAVIVSFQSELELEIITAWRFKR